MAEVKTFKHYEELPSEVRMEVINEMQPIERVMFTQCSKLSRKEAKKSKNYIHELQIQLPHFPDERLAVSVFHKKYEPGVPQGYEMEFKEEGNQKYIIYQIRYGQEFHRVELNESIDLVEYAKEHFKNLLQMYQNTIKSLNISETNNYDFGIRSLRNLKSLSLNQNAEVLPLLSMTRCPLKSLYFQATEDHEMITAGEQIYQVQDYLEADWLKINYEQFKRFNARRIRVGTWNLTSHNVYDFIKSWKSGRIRETFRECWWYLAVSDFDKDELFQLLGLERIGTGDQRFKIKHDTVAGCCAKLNYVTSPPYLMFTVPANGNN